MTCLQNRNLTGRKGHKSHLINNLFVLSNSDMLNSLIPAWMMFSVNIVCSVVE